MKYTREQIDNREYFTSILNSMLDEQVRQGNKRDASVFYKLPYASNYQKGFDWDETEYGRSYYRSFLGDDAKNRPFYRWLKSKYVRNTNKIKRSLYR